MVDVANRSNEGVTARPGTKFFNSRDTLHGLQNQAVVVGAGGAQLNVNQQVSGIRTVICPVGTGKAVNAGVVEQAAESVGTLRTTYPFDRYQCIATRQVAEDTMAQTASVMLQVDGNRLRRREIAVVGQVIAGSTIEQIVAGIADQRVVAATGDDIFDPE